MKQPLGVNLGETASSADLGGSSKFEWKVLSGSFLVSRTGDAGCSERRAKVPKYTLIRYQKGC